MSIESFQLLRTNPELTTNVKLVVSSKYSMYLETFNANKQLSNDKFKHYLIKSDEKYEDKIVKFYDGLKAEHAFNKREKNDKTLNYNEYKEQYETMYWSGANQIEDKWHEEEFEYFAPLYINKKLPENFVIMRVDDVLIHENDKIVPLNKNNFNKEIIDKWKCVENYDLSKNSELGIFLNNNYTSNASYPETSFYLDNRDMSFSKWNGIDYKHGNYTEKSLFLKDVLKYEQPHFKLENLITKGFRDNNIIYPKILNLKYLYDDSPSTPYEDKTYSINRYYGFYLNELELVSNLTSFDFPKLKKDIKLENNIFVDNYNELVYPFNDIWENINHFIYVDNDVYEIEEMKTLTKTYYKIISDKDLNISDISKNNIVDINFVEKSNNEYYNEIVGRNEKLIVDKYINDEGVITGLSGDLYLIKIDEKFHVLKCEEMVIDSSIYDCIYPDNYIEYKENNNFIIKMISTETSDFKRILIIDKKNNETIYDNNVDPSGFMSNGLEEVYLDNEMFLGTYSNKLNKKSLVNKEYSSIIKQELIINKYCDISVPADGLSITNIKDITLFNNNFHISFNYTIKDINQVDLYNRDCVFSISKDKINELFENKKKIEQEENNNTEIIIAIKDKDFTGSIPTDDNYYIVDDINIFDEYDEIDTKIEILKTKNTNNNLYQLIKKTKNDITNYNVYLFLNGDYLLLDKEYLKLDISQKFDLNDFVMSDIVSYGDMLFISTNKGLIKIDEAENEIIYINKDNKYYENSDNITKLFIGEDKLYMISQDSNSYFLYIMDIATSDVDTSLYINFLKDQVSWLSSKNYFVGDFIINENKLYSSLFEESVDIVTSNNYIKFNYTINTDYAINSDIEKLEYWVNNKNNYTSKKTDKEPIIYPVYKATFSDIKDFDFDRVDTDFSKFENEIPTYIKTDEHKLNTKEYRDKSVNKSFKTYSSNSKNTNKVINVSSEYVADDELFETTKDGKLTDIWTKNPSVCKWGFFGSNDNGDYPYKLNNSLKVGSYFNRSVNIFNRESDVVSKNLDYFYRIGNFFNKNLKQIYFNQTLNIETDLMFNDSKKFNIKNYVDCEFDYFDYFFKNKMEFLTKNNTIKTKQTHKYSIFKNGNVYNPSQTLFKGINFEVSGITDIILNDKNHIDKIIKNRNVYNDYKFSIILNDVSDVDKEEGTITYFSFYNEIGLKSSNLDDNNYKDISRIETPVELNPSIYYNDYFDDITYTKKTLSDVKLKKVSEIKLKNLDNYFLRVNASVSDNDVDNKNELNDSVFKDKINIIKKDTKGIIKNFFKGDFYDKENNLIDKIYKLNISNFTNVENSDIYISMENIDKSILMKFEDKVTNLRLDIIDNLYEKAESNSSIINNLDYIEEYNDGIHVFMNEKYKNILIIINKVFDNDFKLNDISEFYDKNDDGSFKIGKERNNIYYYDKSPEYRYDINKLCANNFINAINNPNIKHNFEQPITYHYLTKDKKYGKCKITDFNKYSTMSSLSEWKKNFPPFLLNINFPEKLETKKHSYDVLPLKGPYSTDYASRYLSKNVKYEKHNTIYRYNGGYEPIFKNIELFKGLEYVNNSNFDEDFYPTSLEYTLGNNNSWSSINNTNKDEKLNNNNEYISSNVNNIDKLTNIISVSIPINIPTYSEITGIEIYLNTNMGDIIETTSFKMSEKIDLNIYNLRFSDNDYEVDLDRLKRNNTPNVYFNNGNDSIYQFGDPVDNSVFSKNGIPIVTASCKNVNLEFFFSKNDDTIISNKINVYSIKVKVYYKISFLSDTKYKTDYIKRNSYFDTGLEDFGKIKEMMYSKVNESTNLYNMKSYSPIYPMLDYCGLGFKSTFIFKSTWDKEYYTETKKEIQKINI